MEWIDELLLIMWDFLECMRDNRPNRGPPKRNDPWDGVQ